MTTTNPSVCFLGTGRITAKHISILKKLSPALRLSVASRDLSRAQAMQRRFGLVAAFGNYEEAIQSDFDTVVIATPPRLHFDLVEKSLKAGKNILIEKPIFNSLEEFQKLWVPLKKYSRFVMVLENQWFDPFFQKVRNTLQTHDFGRPLFLNFVRRGLQKRKGWRQDSSEMPLGALHEGGVHWIRKLLGLAGLYESSPNTGLLKVMATTPSFRLTDTPGEDTMVVMARHQSGLVSRLFHSWGLPGGWRDLSTITLEKGSITFSSHGLGGISFGACPNGACCKILSPCFRDMGGYKTMWKHLLTELQKEKGKPASGQPGVTLEDIFFDFTYLDAAYRSLKSGNEEGVLSIPSI